MKHYYIPDPDPNHDVRDQVKHLVSEPKGHKWELINYGDPISYYNRHGRVANVEYECKCGMILSYQPEAHYFNLRTEEDTGPDCPYNEEEHLVMDVIE